MDYKDIYSEVKKRKMEALNKKDVVKAVEKHGKILAIEGKFEKPDKVIDHMYAAEKEFIKNKSRHIKKILSMDLNYYDVILIGCPGSEIPHAAFPKIREFVVNGGWLITTDWALYSIVEPIFPGYIRWNQKKTKGKKEVVACQIVEPNHPFLDGVISELQQTKWSKKGKGDEFKWWLEIGSYPIEVLNHSAVHVLIASWEIKNKYGEAPVLAYFDVGNKGGRVIHMISHTHLQQGGKKGKYASALILTNILDEKISTKMGIGKGPQGPQYVSDWNSPQGQQPQQRTQPPLEDQWVMPNSANYQQTPQQSPSQDYVTPSTGPNLTGTAQITEVNVNDPSFSFGDKCVYCGYDFGEYTGKVYKCSSCGASYHEACINQQVNEGVCKKCNSILLW